MLVRISPAPCCSFDGPPDGVLAGRRATAADEDLIEGTVPARVDGDDDTLAAEALRALGDEIRIAHCRAVDADLICPGKQRRAHILNGADAAAHAEGDENGIGDAADHVEHRVTRFVRGGDVEEDQLVRAFRVVDLRVLDRIARIAQIDEVHALDHAPGVDIEAGDDAFGEHARLPLPG
jgi:hypothetical protein